MTIFKASAYVNSEHSNAAIAVHKSPPVTGECIHPEDINGRFVTSPWEGLRWEPSSSQGVRMSPGLVGGIEEFLASIRHGK